MKDNVLHLLRGCANRRLPEPPPGRPLGRPGALCRVHEGDGGSTRRTVMKRPRALAEDVERLRTADEPVTAWRGADRRAQVREMGCDATARWCGQAAARSCSCSSPSSPVFRSSQSRPQRRNEAQGALASATTALDAERAAKAEAQENFQTARNAVREYFTSVSENVLLKQQGRADLRAAPGKSCWMGA